MAVTLDSLSQTLGAKFQDAQSTLESKLSNLDPSKPQDMIQMQLAMQKWSMTAQLQSNLTQQVGDTLKGIIQKMG